MTDTPQPSSASFPGPTPTSSSSADAGSGQLGSGDPQTYGQPGGGYTDSTYGQPAYGQQAYTDPGYAQQAYGQQAYTGGAYAQQGYAQPMYSTPQKSKLAAGLLGIFLGGLGIHNFYLGNTGKAVAQLLISVLSLGFLSWASMIWGLVEGILILTAQPGTQPWGVDANGIPLRE